MTSKDLANLNQLTRAMIHKYMDKHNMTISEFSRKAQCHQSQIYLYLLGDRHGEQKGLHSSTLEKIGKLLSKK